MSGLKNKEACRVHTRGALAVGLVMSRPEQPTPSVQFLGAASSTAL